MKKLKVKKNMLPIKILLPVTLAIFLPLLFFFQQHLQFNEQYAQTTNHAVSIIDFQFSPATITVPVGSTITWTNNSQGGNHHTTTSNILGTVNSWDSGLTNPGQTFSKTFTQTGTFGYHCNVHNFMVGTVIVVAAATPTPTFTPVPTPTFTPVPTPTSTPIPTPTNPTPTLFCMGSCPNPSLSPTPTIAVPTSTPAPTQATTPTPSTGGTNNPNINALITILLIILELLLKLLGLNVKLH